MGTQFLDIVIGRCTTQQTNSSSTMFRFVALFALVAVAAAEPESDSDAFMQYHHGQEAHMKTVTGDTASVAKAKEDHFQMKAAERPVVYKNQVAQQQFVYKTPSVYTPATYAHSVVPASTYAMPTYTQGAYSAYPYHHLGKRDAEAEAESWY